MMGRRVARGCIGRSHLGAIACGALVAAACGNAPPTLGEGADTDGTGSSSGPQATTVQPEGSTGVGDGATDGGATGGASTDADTAATDTGRAESGDATASESDGGGTDGTTGETGGSGACDRLVQIELDAAGATLSGGWQLATSMLGEGQIAALSSGQFDGSVVWEPDIPCDDAWTIWVRYFEEGGDDSYYVTLDGQPDPAAVFEGDCTAAGEGWGWARLNWRDEATQGACEYTEDPWSPAWTAGTHAIEFSYRETIAIARIVVTNDEAFTP
jgi:hypothetical protein